MDPVDEPARERSRGIYLLPNLLTTGGLFSGFYAILAAASGDFENACIAGWSRRCSTGSTAASRD